MTTNLIVRATALSALLILAGCKPDGDDCFQKKINSSTVYQSAFDHCMNRASEVSKSGTHDNSYNTVDECESYAYSIDHAVCQEKKP